MKLEKKYGSLLGSCRRSKELCPISDVELVLERRLCDDELCLELSGRGGGGAWVSGIWSPGGAGALCFGILETFHWIMLHHWPLACSNKKLSNQHFFHPLNLIYPEHFSSEY